MADMIELRRNWAVLMIEYREAKNYQELAADEVARAFERCASGDGEGPSMGEIAMLEAMTLRVAEINEKIKLFVERARVEAST